MGESELHKVLQRKARTGREEHEARMMTPARAVRLALARAADDLFELPLVVSGVQIAQVTQDALLQQVRDDWVTVVLDGPDGALGVAAVDMDVLAALIESQTLGRVLPGSAEPRLPTHTDAALIAPLLDSALDRMSNDLDGQGGGICAKGFRFGARIENARMLGLVLEAPEFHLFRMDLDLGGSAKHGEMILALPEAIVAAETGEDRPGEAAGGEAEGPEESAAVLGKGAFLTAEAPLDAVLWRLKMPLAELEKLVPGDVLEMPREALVKTRLEAGKERPIGECRLGQINGFRAVRITRLEGEVPGERAPAETGGAVGEGAAPRLDDRPGPENPAARNRTANAAVPAVVPDPSSGDAVYAPSREPADIMADFPDMADLPGLEPENLEVLE